ncbi:MAG: 3-oxoacyl-[acyl-carrier protein] reductase [Halioglobus sp.]|jgi:3-oxoacyl-[acyl-carrier protein] reductase
MGLAERDRAYIIVGGSKGMGLEVTKLLAASGARIAIISRHGVESALATVPPELSASISSVIGDATQAESIGLAISEAVEALGGMVHGLVTTNAERRYGDLLDSSDADWLHAFENLVMGTVRCCRAVIPHMIKAGSGSIVTLGAYSVRSPKSYLFPYSSSKASIVNITKNIALTYGPKGVRANCVCPGVIETERAKKRLDDLVTEHGITRDEAGSLDVTNLGMRVALQRLGKPGEVANLIAFLLSEKSSYINGALINIDGGTEF